MDTKLSRMWLWRAVMVVVLCCDVIVQCSALSSPSASDKLQFVFKDKRQEEFAKGLDDFIFTVPIRVTSEGDYVTNHLHAKHRVVKRHAAPTSPDSNTAKDTGGDGANHPPPQSPGLKGVDDAFVAVEENDVIHYRIPVHDGKEVVVSLRENVKLLSPSAVVETKTRRFFNASDSQFRSLNDKRGCHLTGTVAGDGDSRVALAACDGLSGFFHTEGEQYIIEPVKGHGPANLADPDHSQPHPHIVYKRSALPAHLNEGSNHLHSAPAEPTCGVKDDIGRVLRRRERWERHRRNAENKMAAEEEEAAEGRSKRSRRKKRSISSEKSVETLVVVDPDMMKYYENEDIENYILTVMNMVATLFHDASIGNAVNIVIVRMLLMKDPDEELKITHHAEKTLNSFCKWQKTVNFRDDDHPHHHDVAVLLTRRNICNRMNQPCSTLGLAQVSGMCQPHRSCNINEDTGLSLAWTVTHELGHNFAMKHDSKHNQCLSPPGEMYVMAPHLSWDLVPSKWSNCSRRSITEFLDRDWGYCLDDEPSHHDFKYPVLPAGTMYDADHQCRLLYGNDAALCGGIQDLENICSTLWCRVNNKCSTKLQPAAEGTICGTNKWCFAGKCVQIGDRPQAINGEWGEWGGWTDCTRTCGAGVTQSERHCNHPPPSNGGNYCLGERKRFRICNSEDCPDDGVSFRQVQCSEFNTIPYKGNNYEWIPVATPETPCQLHCKPKDMFFSVLLKDISTDGTPCIPGKRHMCISGRCRHVGCDWEIDSAAREDRCGVCYGDGSTCTTVKKQFNETKEHGYVEATVIPRGARNIRVEEVASVSNFLALANEEGEYYLNGHWFIQWSGDYEMAGTVVHYDRHGNKESFKALGPLKEPLKIMLLMQTYNPGVVFEYTVPKENVTDTRKPEFRWDYTDWSHCTLSCGGGTQRTEVICVEQEAGRVDDRNCDADTKPDDRLRSCNEHLCPARWWTGPWQHCSVTCGDDGIHKRTVMCVRSLGADEQIALEDSMCGDLKKPRHVESCKKKEPCVGSAPTWMTGNWTQCNGNPCATKTRTVLCSDVTKGCDPFTRPAASQPCTNVTCGIWQTEEWSSCTRTCEGGVQYRKVTCIGGSICDIELEPPAEQTCGNEPCPQPTSTENKSGPSPTESAPEIVLTLAPPAPTKSQKPGTTSLEGEKENPNKQDKDSIVLNAGEGSSMGKSETSSSSSENIMLGGPSSSPVNAEPENPNEPPPPQSSANVNSDNNDAMVIGSAPSLPGNEKIPDENNDVEPSASPKHKLRHHGKNNPKNRHHHHKQKELDEDRSTNLQPELADIVEGGSPEDVFSDGKTPAVPSGTPSETPEAKQGESKKDAKELGKEEDKEVVPPLNDIADGDMKVANDDVEDEEMQKGVESDGDDDDFEWYAGEWRQCSSECGDGVQTRAVSCIRKSSGMRAEGKLCSILTKPSAIQECNTDPCRQWSASPWGECSATCGYAMRRRSVTCPDGGRCDPKIKPREVEVCSSLSPCIAWVTGDWSTCSKTCDGGTQKRIVQCVNMTSQHVSEACDGAIRPSERQSCNVEDCPATDAAFGVRCESNEMSYKVCRMLKKVGLCHKDYVQAKCCRTCTDHKRKSPAVRIADLR